LSRDRPRRGAVNGDLGKITAGDLRVGSSTIKKVQVFSFGALGTSTGAPDTQSAVLATIDRVSGERRFWWVLERHWRRAVWHIRKRLIGGALKGGNLAGSGQLVSHGRLGSAVIGSIEGGTGNGSGALLGEDLAKSTIARWS
jgi:hypothetical protein